MRVTPVSGPQGSFSRFSTHRGSSRSAVRKWNSSAIPRCRPLLAASPGGHFIAIASQASATQKGIASHRGALAPQCRDRLDPGENPDARNLSGTGRPLTLARRSAVAPACLAAGLTQARHRSLVGRCRRLNCASERPALEQQPGIEPRPRNASPVHPDSRASFRGGEQFQPWLSSQRRRRERRGVRAVAHGLA